MKFVYSFHLNLYLISLQQSYLNCDYKGRKWEQLNPKHIETERYIALKLLVNCTGTKFTALHTTMTMHAYA